MMSAANLFFDMRKPHEIEKRARARILIFFIKNFRIIDLIRNLVFFKKIVLSRSI